MFFVSCNKFFDIKPSSTSINPTTVSDFKEVLNADSNAMCDYFLMDISSDADSLPMSLLLNPNYSIANAYLWKKKIWDDSQTDEMYNTAYSRILQMNVILEKISNASLDANSTEEDRSIIVSQALINRAYYYWQLANIYGPTYQESTSSQDLTVPLVTSANANNLPRRATSKEMYNFIVTDLRKSISNENLPAMGVDIIHPGKGSGFALLSRTYLYMNKYDSALLYADSALLLKHDLMDYNSYQMPTELLSLKSNPEIYLARFCSNSSFYEINNSSFYPSGNLLKAYTSVDQRLNLFFTFDRFLGYSNYNLTNGSELDFDYSISVPEMLLTKAECLARVGMDDEAINLINELRIKRIVSYSYAPIVDYNADNTDSIVLAERQRELSFHGGLRWFDLKRLNKEAKFSKTIYRYAYDESYNVITIASLNPNSPNYVIPFSTIIVDNNPNLIQNVRE